MRKIDSIVIHCDANDSPRWGLKELQILHAKWGGPGYHFWIDFHGVAHNTRPIEKKGAHEPKMNSRSIGICLHGDKVFFAIQYEELKKLCFRLCLKYNIPPENIYPHNQFNTSKTCPNFDVAFIRKYVDEELKKFHGGE